MTVAKSSRSHDDLQQLLDERQRFEQWIATLESKRESTPEHVFKRVRADYEQRLATVRDQLTDRTGEIRSAISGLKDRLKQAADQETARTDELHEAELRAVVGEFTPEQWELRKREVQVELKRFADEKKKISDELNQLLLIIEQTTEHAPAEHGATAPPTPAQQTPAQPIPAAPPPAPVQADNTRARSRTPSRSRAAMHTAPASAAEEEKPPVPIESLAPADGLPVSSPETAADAGAVAKPATAEQAPAAPEKSDSRSGSQAKRGKPSEFAPASPDARRANEKTLKCGECGAMNYPTEWYCESCGAELSAL